MPSQLTDRHMCPVCDCQGDAVDNCDGRPTPKWSQTRTLARAAREGNVLRACAYPAQAVEQVWPDDRGIVVMFHACEPAMARQSRACCMRRVSETSDWNYVENPHHLERRRDGVQAAAGKATRSAEQLSTEDHRKGIC